MVKITFLDSIKMSELVYAIGNDLYTEPGLYIEYPTQYETITAYNNNGNTPTCKEFDTLQAAVDWLLNNNGGL